MKNYMLMKYLFLLLVLSSCSAHWHLTKAKKKDPSLFNQDTIIETRIEEVEPVTTDTITFEALKDTVYLMLFQKDTTKEKIKVRFIPTGNGIKSEIDCPDCIETIKTINIPTPVEKKLTNWRRFWVAWDYILGVFFIGLILGFIAKMLL